MQLKNKFPIVKPKLAGIFALFNKLNGFLQFCCRRSISIEVASTKIFRKKKEYPLT